MNILDKRQMKKKCIRIINNDNEQRIAAAADLGLVEMWRNPGEASFTFKIKLKENYEVMCNPGVGIKILFTNVTMLADGELKVYVHIYGDDDKIEELIEAYGLTRVKHTVSLHVNGDYLDHYEYMDADGIIISA